MILDCIQCFTEFVPMHIRVSFDKIIVFYLNSLFVSLTSCHFVKDVLHIKSIL